MRAALLVVAVLTTTTTAACHRDSPRAARLSTTDAEQALIDRNWMDRWPEHKDDRLRLYRFTPSMGPRMVAGPGSVPTPHKGGGRWGGGVYQDRKVFKGQFELFRYHAGDGTIAFDFPDTDEQARSPFLIERVRGHEPFDLRLTIADDPRGPGVYWAIAGARGHNLEPALQ